MADAASSTVVGKPIDIPAPPVSVLRPLRAPAGESELIRCISCQRGLFRVDVTTRGFVSCKCGRCGMVNELRVDNEMAELREESHRGFPNLMNRKPKH